MIEPKPLSANRLNSVPMVAADREDGTPTPPESPRRARCRLARGSEQSRCLTDELSCLLHTRLRIAALIILGGMVLHFFRNLWDPASTLPGVGLFIHGVTMLAIAAVAVIVWLPHPLYMKQVRVLEVAMFGVTAFYFAWLHFIFLRSGVVADQEAKAVRLMGSANAYRWFLLAVVYGMFIPNTWRRCAVVAGSMTVAPVLLTVCAPFFSSTPASYVGLVLPDTAILMATALAIAVFGSHKIRELHQQAHEAQRLGQYRLKEVIGFGGMGAVYLAEHVLLRRPCAIKVIRADQAGDPRTLVRFEREVQAAATLTHWNTIEIFDYGHAEDGTFYYVMEYLPGMNLEELVENHGPMPPERAVHFLRQVCQALREAHSLGIIHRDIKPSNVFACERGKVYDVAKLLDFGLVKNFGMNDSVKLTQEGSMAGSPAFMSPEQAAGKQQLDAKSDIYNVGAVGYYLITGELLFNRDSPLQMLHAHAYEPVVPICSFQKEVPAELQQVILRCLEKDPARRYPDADSLDRALASCECAGLWTPERAEQWWRQFGTKVNEAPAKEISTSDVVTVLEKV